MKGMVLADERGRITLGSKTIDEYGRKFAVVKTKTDIVLIPIAKDPLAKLAEIGRKAGIDKYSIKELKRMGREEAEKEIGKHVRGH